MPSAAGVELCVDANEGYKTPGEAIRTIRKMEQYDLKYAEQPVMGIERMAEVARAIDTPVMADELAWNAHDVIEIIERRAAQIVSIYTTKPGGLYRAMEVAAVCRAAGIVCNVNGSVETGVGNLANLQLAAAAQAVTLSCVVPVSTPAEAQHGQIGGIYYQDDLIARGMDICRWRDRVAERSRHGHRCRSGENREVPSEGLTVKDMRTDIIDAAGRGDRRGRASTRSYPARRKTSPTRPVSWCRRSR